MWMALMGQSMTGDHMPCRWALALGLRPSSSGSACTGTCSQVMGPAAVAVTAAARARSALAAVVAGDSSAPLLPPQDCRIRLDASSIAPARRALSPGAGIDARKDGNLICARC